MQLLLFCSICFSPKQLFVANAIPFIFYYLIIIAAMLHSSFNHTQTIQSFLIKNVGRAKKQGWQQLKTCRHAFIKYLYSHPQAQDTHIKISPCKITKRSSILKVTSFSFLQRYQSQFSLFRHPPRDASFREFFDESSKVTVKLFEFFHFAFAFEFFALDLSCLRTHDFPQKSLGSLHFTDTVFVEHSLQFGDLECGRLEAVLVLPLSYSEDYVQIFLGIRFEAKKDSPKFVCAVA